MSRNQILTAKWIFATMTKSAGPFEESKKNKIDDSDKSGLPIHSDLEQIVNSPMDYMIPALAPAFWRSLVPNPRWNTMRVTWYWNKGNLMLLLFNVFANTTPRLLWFMKDSRAHGWELSSQFFKQTGYYLTRPKNTLYYANPTFANLTNYVTVDAILWSLHKQGGRYRAKH